MVQAKGKKWKEAELKSVNGGLDGLMNDPSIADLSVIVSIAPEGSSHDDVPVMLSTVKYPDFYMYVPSGSWQVKGHRTDPGAGGYWYFEPRLPDELRSRLLNYTGPRCD